jgi:hypothetical protein
MAVVSTDDDYTPSVQMLDELKQRNQNKLKPTLKSVIIDATILLRQNCKEVHLCYHPFGVVEVSLEYF